MKIIIANHSRRTENTKLELDYLIGSLLAPGSAFLRKYQEVEGRKSKLEDVRSEVGLKLHWVYEMTGGNLQGKTFLDLGCGSTSYDKYVGYDNWMGIPSSSRTFEPWLCRVLHEVGVHVIGVDVGSLAHEEFEHYSRDLLSENALQEIPDHSIDFAHSRLLYDSPQLITNMVKRKDFPQMAREVRANALYWSLLDQARLAERVLKSQLFPQIERVLKPTGVYLCNE